jgi:DNA gyrase/topoisomerase IV subunit B
MNVFQLHKKFVTTLIRDTIETYPGAWRLVHEAAQNAADAIYRNDKIKRGQINIDVHLGTNKVVVSDNGIGIPVANFDSFFQLGGGDKRDESVRKFLKGSQGVGIKATCFTSTHFKVSTIHEGQAWDFTADNFHRFADPAFGADINPPQPTVANSPSERRSNIHCKITPSPIS